MSMIKLQSPVERQQRIHYLVDTSLEPLGVGGMGQVFKGIRVDEATGVCRDVAIKFLFDDLPEHAIERARREASIQIHNENLVEMFGFIQIDELGEDGLVYKHYHVVSELLQGVMLFDLLNGHVSGRNGQPILFAQELYQQYMDNRSAFSLRIIKNVLSGIMALHDNGYVHRDLDPSNIMITSDRKIKVIDFGIAKQINTLCTQDRQLTSAGAFIGKASYAAPELVLGDVSNQNETTDIYAVGIMLYQFVVGKLPFEGASHEVLDMHLRGKMPLNDIKDKGIRKIIEKATQKKQAERFQSAAEFRVAIEKLEREMRRKDLDMSETTMVNKIVPDDKKKKKNLIIAGLCAGVLLLAGFCWMIVDGKKKAEIEQREKARQEMIDARIAELEHVILDSNNPECEIDTLTGTAIKTAGFVTKEAEKKILSGDTGLVKEGLEMLDKVILKNYASSSEAMLLKSVLLYEDPSHFTPSQKAMKSQVDTLMLERDNVLAHELTQKAVGLDSTNYKALYELGCDYFAGPVRTNRDGSRNIPLALQCFYKGLEHAEKADDIQYKEMFEKRIRQLK